MGTATIIAVLPTGAQVSAQLENVDVETTPNPELGQLKITPITLSGMPAYGEITLTDNATATVMTNQNEAYPVAGAWGDDVAGASVAYDLTAGTLTILPGGAGLYLTICSLAFTSGAAPETVKFGLFKNGNPIPDHVAVSWTDTTTYPNSVTVSGIDNIAPGDVIDLRVTCLTAEGISVTVTNCNFSIIRQVITP